MEQTIETAVADTAYGPVRYCVDDEFIGRSLRLYGEYSAGEPELWSKLLFGGERALDVGANIGVFTLALANLVGPQGQVIAFEPQVQNYKLLEENAIKYGNIITFCKACSAPGELITRVSSFDALGHKNYGRIECGPQGDLVVDVTTIDEVLNGDAVGFIKIDVEGMELEVLLGGAESIRKWRPILYLENDRPQNSAKLINWVHSLGYRLFEHTPPLYSPKNPLGIPVNVFGNIVSINLVCIPEERVGQHKKALQGLKPVVPTIPSAGKPGWAGIVRLGGVGDNLMAASVLPLLKQKGYKIDVITQTPQSVIFENNPYVDKLSVKEALRDLPQNDMNAWQAWFASRSNEYDFFVNLSHSCEGLLAFFPAMTYFWWPDAARRHIANRSYIEMVHDICDVPYRFGPLFFPSDEEKAQALNTRDTLPGGKRRAVIGWCISGTRLDKVYPQSPIAIARLIRELDVHVVMLGAPGKDFEIARQVQEHVILQNGTDAGLHLALSPDANNPSWPIRRILSFAILGCDLVIGPDTGPLWAVAFEQVPKILLLGHASAENITKHWVNTQTLSAAPQVSCYPCHCLHDSIDTCLDKQRRAGIAVNPQAPGPPCISSISVEELVSSAVTALESVK